MHRARSFVSWFSLNGPPKSGPYESQSQITNRKSRESYPQLAAENCYRMAGEQNAITGERDAKHAAARRRLICHKALFSETGSPVRRQRAMRRACHRVLIDPGARREEPRDEIETR